MHTHSDAFDHRDRGVEAGDLFAVKGARRIRAVEGLEADGISFEVDALERGLVVRFEAGKAVVAINDGPCWAEDDDIALGVRGFHGVADDACCECVGIGDVGAADVFIGDACGVGEVGELGGIARGDFVDQRDIASECNGKKLWFLFFGCNLIDELAECAGGVGIVEGATVFAAAEEVGESACRFACVGECFDIAADAGSADFEAAAPSAGSHECSGGEFECLFEAREQWVAWCAALIVFKGTQVALGAPDAGSELSE